MRVGLPELDILTGRAVKRSGNSGSCRSETTSDRDRASVVGTDGIASTSARYLAAYASARTRRFAPKKKDKIAGLLKEKPQTHIRGSASGCTIRSRRMGGEIKRLSGAFRKYPEVYFATGHDSDPTLELQDGIERGNAIVSPNASPG